MQYWNSTLFWVSLVILLAQQFSWQSVAGDGETMSSLGHVNCWCSCRCTQQNIVLLPWHLWQEETTKPICKSCFKSCIPEEPTHGDSKTDFVVAESVICRIPVGNRHTAAAILNCSPLSSCFLHVWPAVFSALNKLTGAMLPSESECEVFEVGVGRPLPSGETMPNQTMSMSLRTRTWVSFM